MMNIDKSGFRKGQYVGYGGNRVWRISKSNSSSGNWFAVNQNNPNQQHWAMTLKAMAKKLEALPLENMPKQNPSARNAGRAAYIRRPSQITKKRPVKRLKKRRAKVYDRPRKGYWANPSRVSNGDVKMWLMYLPANAAHVFLFGRDVGSASIVAMGDQTFFTSKADAVAAAERQGLKVGAGGVVSAASDFERRGGERRSTKRNPISATEKMLVKRLLTLRKEQRTAPADMQAQINKDITAVQRRLGEFVAAYAAVRTHRAARKENPAKGAAVYAICIQKGNGPVMHYDGERFSNNAAPKLFTRAAGRKFGRNLMMAYGRQLEGYRVVLTDKPPLKNNPSPRTNEGLAEAAKRLESFSGHSPGKVLKITEPDFKTGLVIGSLDAVPYTTKRDGKVEHYIHRFNKKSRPLLAVSSDGTQLRIVGGQYEFTEAGIEDRAS